MPMPTRSRFSTSSSRTKAGNAISKSPSRPNRPSPCRRSEPLLERGVRIPHVEQLVGAWEAGAGLRQTDRALAFLAAAEPDLSRAALAALPIGERDRRLLELRRELFGPRLDATAMCPVCETRVEFEIALATVLLPASAAADSAPL